MISGYGFIFTLMWNTIMEPQKIHLEQFYDKKKVFFGGGAAEV